MRQKRRILFPAVTEHFGANLSWFGPRCPVLPGHKSQSGRPDSIMLCDTPREVHAPKDESTTKLVSDTFHQRSPGASELVLMFSLRSTCPKPDACG